MNITFLLNGESVELSGVSPDATLLNWLRENRHLTGTKEGCNEGDCGACTVMVTDENGPRALNACILFLPQLHGKAVRTVEGLSCETTLHPAQQTMIDHHGSQCGFCTPGFAVSMAVAHLNDDQNHDDVLAGNLCRCTGYAPIIRAAEALATQPKPNFPETTPGFFEDTPQAGETDSASQSFAAPSSSDELAQLYAETPEATLIAGATDVGLWVTKQHRPVTPAIFLNRCKDLQEITETETGFHIGAMVTMDRILPLMQTLHPSYAEMIRRYASTQIRAAATIGGNIANGSPIGDNPPALIALGATLHLRHRDSVRDLPIEEFFIDYGKQDRARGEFVTGITLPKQPDRLRVYKISKRFDQDISAVLAAFNITVTEGTVTQARIAFGGMAGIPKRASAVEAALMGQTWGEEAVAATQDAWAQDFTPLSDMRASAAYRLATASNLLSRYLLEDLGTLTDVREVRA